MTKKLTILPFMIAAFAFAQNGARLVRATPAESPIRATYTLTPEETSMGCKLAFAGFAEAKMVRIDCSAAMPWSSKDKTIRSFCVVRPGETLQYAMVEPKSRELRWCEVSRRRD
jgi:hypothetical protein